MSENDGKNPSHTHTQVGETRVWECERGSILEAGMGETEGRGKPVGKMETSLPKGSHGLSYLKLGQAKAQEGRA